MESTPNPFALSPNTHILIDTSETPAAPNARVSGPESHIPSLRQAASHKHVVQRPELNNASRPPSYYANSPLWDPFRDGDAPTGYFYTGNTGMQNGSNSATAAYIVPVPTTTAPLLDPIKRVPSANTNPFLGEMPLDEELPPLLPPRPCNFERGLQIPSRVSLITWGFSFPEILAEQGINKEQWRSFKHELESFARLGIFDIITMIGTQMIVSHFFGVIPGLFLAWYTTKRKEHRNFRSAYRSGAFTPFENRWNNEYFHPLHLHVRIEPPGIGMMDEMDVSSTKLYKYQRKMGTSSPAPGIASEQGDKKEYKYQRKEGRYRMKAVRKGRIVIMPYSAIDAVTLQPYSGSDKGQSRGVTMVNAGPSVQDYGSLSPTKSRFYYAPPTGQYPESSQQGQSSRQSFYVDSSHGDAGRASFQAAARATY